MPAQDPQHVRRRGSQIELPPWGTYALMALFIVAVLGLAYFTFNAVKNVIAEMPGAPEPGGPGDTTGGVGGGTGDSGTGSTSGGGQIAAWDGGRVTILLLGI